MNFILGKTFNQFPPEYFVVRRDTKAPNIRGQRQLKAGEIPPVNTVVVPHYDLYHPRHNPSGWLDCANPANRNHVWNYFHHPQVKAKSTKATPTYRSQINHPKGCSPSNWLLTLFVGIGFQPAFLLAAIQHNYPGYALAGLCILVVCVTFDILMQR